MASDGFAIDPEEMQKPQPELRGSVVPDTSRQGGTGIFSSIIEELTGLNFGKAIQANADKRLVSDLARQYTNADPNQIVLAGPNKGRRVRDLLKTNIERGKIGNGMSSQARNDLLKFATERDTVDQFNEASKDLNRFVLENPEAGMEDLVEETTRIVGARNIGAENARQLLVRVAGPNASLSTAGQTKIDRAAYLDTAERTAKETGNQALSSAVAEARKNEKASLSTIRAMMTDAQATANQTFGEVQDIGDYGPAGKLVGQKNKNGQWTNVRLVDTDESAKSKASGKGGKVIELVKQDTVTGKAIPYIVNTAGRTVADVNDELRRAGEKGYTYKSEGKRSGGDIVEGIVQSNVRNTEQGQQAVDEANQKFGGYRNDTPPKEGFVPAGDGVWENFRTGESYIETGSQDLYAVPKRKNTFFDAASKSMFTAQKNPSLTEQWNRKRPDDQAKDVRVANVNGRQMVYKIE